MPATIFSEYFATWLKNTRRFEGFWVKNLTNIRPDFIRVQRARMVTILQILRTTCNAEPCFSLHTMYLFINSLFLIIKDDAQCISQAHMITFHKSLRTLTSWWQPVVMTQPVAVVEVCCTLPGGGLLLLYTTPALLEVCCRCSECTAHFPPRADETSA